MLSFGTKIPGTKHEVHDAASSACNVAVYTHLTYCLYCVRLSWQLWRNWISALLIRQSGSSARVFIRVLERKADTLN